MSFVAVRVSHRIGFLAMELLTEKLLLYIKTGYTNVDLNLYNSDLAPYIQNFCSARCKFSEQVLNDTRDGSIYHLFDEEQTTLFPAECFSAPYC